MRGGRLLWKGVILSAKAVAFLIFIPPALFAFCFDRAAQEYSIPRQLIESVAETESGLNPRAINQNANGSFDMGLMQVNSYWVRVMDLQKERLMDDPCYNVMAGARILKQCIDRHGYNWEAVGCYNAASMQKKINYSWKVYRALANRPKEPQAREAQEKNASSLVFEVRDITEQGAVRP
jgi:soluble lytic murein transglycosylase-like protein